MKTLDEAWKWYRAVKEGMRQLEHLAKFWDALPWTQGAAWVADLEHDNVLRNVSASAILGQATTVKLDLDDLAVLVLFSVFEAIIRETVKDQIRPEVNLIRHDALRRAAETFLEDVEDGSFFGVLQILKSPATNDAVEKVNKVRKYRNWVAHGRRSAKPLDHVRPEDAHSWLTEFLALVGSPPPLAAPPTTGGP
jgi:hypothetical protein